MFDIGWGELVVIGIVALVVIGPKELPTVLRTVGQWVGKMRRMAAEFQGQFQEAMREAELADLKKQIDSLHDTTNNFSFNPAETARREIEGTLDKPQAAQSPSDERPSSGSETAGIEAGAEPAAASPSASAAEVANLPPLELPPPDLPEPVTEKDLAASPSEKAGGAPG